MQLFHKTIRLEPRMFWVSFLLIVIVEAFSLIAYQGATALQPVFLGLILLGTAILAFRNLEYGLLVVFAELFVGSFGHLFQVEIGSFRISLRIGLFLLLNGIFFIHSLTHRSFPFRKSRYFWPNVAFFWLIVYGFVLAFWHGYPLQDIFYDADAYIFFAYFPAMFAALKNRESRDRLIQVFLASLVWVSIQTGIILFVFSHHLRNAMQALYLWTRDARIGEITLVGGDFYRIFFQSYLFALIGLFLFGVRLVFGKLAGSSFPERTKGTWVFFVLAAFLVLESFSRSFWFGGVITGLVMLGTLLMLRVPWALLWRGILRMVAGVGMALALIFVIVNFPFPPKGPPVLLANLFGGRAISLFGEAAAATRWKLLPVLLDEVKKTPIMGAGFGKTVTYETEDPRTLAENEFGIRTTYAFEWGYLDLWLKLGIPGLVVYGWLIVLILRQGWRRVRDSSSGIHGTEYGLWLGVIALLATHVFTPFLNHPLGIGFLILSAAWFDSHEHETV